MDFVRSKTNCGLLATGQAGAQRILIVGPLGQGVGLMADAITLAAARAGSPAGTFEFMRPGLARRTCAAVVRLGSSSHSAAGSADFLLAVGAAAALEARPLLAACGAGLAMVDARSSDLRRPMCDRLYDARIRCWIAPGAAQAPLSRAWMMLGWLSGRLAWPLAGWREVLADSVPRRMSMAARVAFEQGRLIDCRAGR
ncbi:MAG TPA: hypothetical protein VHY20_01580 [Pirellulales bacterium]|jgi:hypothetical protein|nr:hypothetical protein [Pirellulales bacterium]